MKSGERGQSFGIRSYFEEPYLRLPMLAMAAGVLIVVLVISRDPLWVGFGVVAAAAVAYQVVWDTAHVRVTADAIQVHISRRIRPTIIDRDSVISVNRLPDGIELRYRAKALLSGDTVERRVKLKPHDPEALLAALESPHAGFAVSSESEERARRDLLLYGLVLVAAIPVGILIARFT